MRSRLVAFSLMSPSMPDESKPKRAANRSERRAQFMAYRGNELILQPIECIALADIAEAEHRTGEVSLVVNWSQRVFSRERTAILAKYIFLAGGSMMPSASICQQRAVIPAAPVLRRVAVHQVHEPTCR